MAFVAAARIADIKAEATSHMAKINGYITNLLTLSKDPRRHGELINILDTTIDKIESEVTTLHQLLLQEIEKKSEEFASALSALDDLATMRGSTPPPFLAAIDRERWHKLAAPGVLLQQLASFKKSLIGEFTEQLTNQLQLDKLIADNRAMKEILANIRKELLV